MRTADRWQRVQEIFSNAADLPESDQAAYLDRACLGDAALRAAVERMLAADRSTGDPISAAVRQETVLLAGRVDPLAGKGKVGKYEVLAPVGEGGFGVVYKGRDPMLQRFVAIKACTSRDKKVRQRFFREAQIAAGLQHPNVVTIHDLGIQDGVPYLVQEYLEGEDLDRPITRGEALTMVRRLDILTQVAAGLAYAHERGVLHRDVKPANVRLVAGGSVKLMDFGIARLLDDEVRLTSQGQTIGTIGYLAPEQLRGEEPDRRSDIFSFGVLAYELVSGERPFAGESFSETAVSLLQGDLVPLARRVADCPPALDALVGVCLAREREARPTSFAEVAAVLHELGREAPPLAGAGASGGEPVRRATSEVVALTPPPPPAARARSPLLLVLALLLAGALWWRLAADRGAELPTAGPVPTATTTGSWQAPRRLSPAERAARLRAVEVRLGARRLASAAAGSPAPVFVVAAAAVGEQVSSLPPPQPGDQPPRLRERGVPRLAVPVPLDGGGVQLVVAVLVAADGSVATAEVRDTSDVRPELVAAALAAARASRFDPAVRQGEPIAAWSELVYRFR